MVDDSSGVEPLSATHIAAQDSIRALKWIGVLALVYSAVNTLTPPPTPLPMLIGDVLLGVLFIAVGVVLTRTHATPDVVAWGRF